jgi:hypothetical protein
MRQSCPTLFHHLHHHCPSPNPQPRTSHDRHPSTSQPLRSPIPFPTIHPFSLNPNFPNTIATERLPLLEPV